MFHNTISLEGEELVKANKQTTNQEDLIEAIFKANTSVAISPSQLLSIFKEKYDWYIPITSIRRGLSNLTKADILIKTSKMIKGTYHLNEHCWMYYTVDNLQYRVEKQEKGVSTGDFANKIIEHSINKTYVQPVLFDDNAREEKKNEQV